MPKLAAIKHSDLPAVLSLLSEVGFSFTPVRTNLGHAQLVTHKDLNPAEEHFLKIGDGHVMSTHPLPGLTCMRTYSGMTWNYYVLL